MQFYFQVNLVKAEDTIIGKLIQNNDLGIFKYYN